ncbi:hypothetical protein BgiMline_027209, partial [Biomphalaria glabrata]
KMASGGNQKFWDFVEPDSEEIGAEAMDYVQKKVVKTSREKGTNIKTLSPSRTGPLLGKALSLPGQTRKCNNEEARLVNFGDPIIKGKNMLLHKPENNKESKEQSRRKEALEETCQDLPQSRESHEKNSNVDDNTNKFIGWTKKKSKKAVGTQTVEGNTTRISESGEIESSSLTATGSEEQFLKEQIMYWQSKCSDEKDELVALRTMSASSYLIALRTLKDQEEQINSLKKDINSMRVERTELLKQLHQIKVEKENLKTNMAANTAHLNKVIADRQEISLAVADFKCFSCRQTFNASTRQPILLCCQHLICLFCRNGRIDKEEKDKPDLTVE